ncbi:MAG TPA: FAD-linked oxidase C-terminal domain-containing protein [Actinomycetota bacterium]
MELNAGALERDLSRALQGEVRFSDGDRALYATDGSNYRMLPIGVVNPRSIDDVVATVEVCRDHGAPIVNRGGGTSLAGQTCNVAVVIDSGKHLRRILELNHDENFARVQPGVVLDDLRNRAEEHQLTFAPDPSTHEYCTLGGMIGNNSCGVHSVMGGLTADNVIELDVITADGTRMTLRRVDDEEELQRIIDGGGRRGEIHSRLRDFRDRYADRIRERFPDIPRRVSGYNLPDLLPENGFDVAKSVVGSESTLVTVLEAKVRLVHSPPARSLLVLGFPDVYEAADAVPQVMEFGPVGLEGLDDRLISDMKIKKVHPEDIELLPEGKGWLVAEFGGQSKDESDAAAKRCMQALKKTAQSLKLYDDDEIEAKIWEVRESGLGATARIPRHPDTWEGWEDSAAPPERFGDYLRDLRQLFDQFGYDGSFYGHFGQGCLHTRINFDMVTAEGVRRFRSFIEHAADLVVSYGGSLSGEHGDGQSRAEFLPKMFGEEIVEAFRELKTIWDPDGRMNPGKVVDPYGLTQNLRLGPDYAPWHPETHFSFPEEEGGGFARATARCVGVGKCRREEGGIMCPSYMVTHEEKDSTRGRARLLFELLNQDEIGRKGWKDDAVLDALDLCLSCKGCKTDCPVNVDMATYKAEFLSHYYEGRLRPRTAYSIGLITWWSRLGSLVPGIANAVLKSKTLGGLMKRLGGIAPKREAPEFAHRTFTGWYRRRSKRDDATKRSRPAVILWPDTFNDHFHPDTLKAAVKVLETAGFGVVIPPRPLCCGRPLYDFGMLPTAKKLLGQIMTTLRPAIRRGIPIVGLEPSCVAVFRDELKNLFPRHQDADRLSKQTYILSEFLEKYAPGFRPPTLDRKAVVQRHCHHQAVMGFDADETWLAKLGLETEILDSGCCGMAGAFGFEEDHYDVSMAAGERVVLPKVREAGDDVLIVADGFSCREQIRQGTGKRAYNMAELIAMALTAGGVEAPPSSAGPSRDVAGPGSPDSPDGTRGPGGLAATEVLGDRIVTEREASRKD